MWVVDAGSGEVVWRLTCGEIFERFPESAELEKKAERWVHLELLEPALTGDGRYLILPCQLIDFAGSEEEEPVYFFVWDRETGLARELPEEITAGLARDLTYESYYKGNGWLAPGESLVVLYDREKGLLKVADLSQGKVLHELAAEEKREYFIE